MKIRARPVEELDHSRIDVPNPVGCRRPDPELGLLRVETPPWPSPLVATNDSVPGGRGGEDLPESLGENGEGAGRHVAVVRGGSHFLDDSELRGRELAWVVPWAGGDVVERAVFVLSPGMVSARGQTEDPKSDSKRKDSSGTFHRSKKAPFVFAVSDSSPRECNAETFHESEEETQNGDEPSVPLLELDDFSSQFERTFSFDIESRNVLSRRHRPVACGRSRDAALDGESYVTGFSDQLPEPRVIAATRAMGGHEPMVRILGQ